MQTSLHNGEAATLAQRALEEWGDMVYRVALSQTGSPADADDIYQDVFLKLVDAPPRFESEAHLKAWLIRVAVNRSHDVHRARTRHPVDALDSHLAEAERKLAEEQPTEDDPGAFDSELWQQVGRLPEEQRVVVNLFYVEGLSSQEIADALGCSNGAVRSRLYRAREALRAALVASHWNPARLQGKD